MGIANQDYVKISPNAASTFTHTTALKGRGTLVSNHVNFIETQKKYKQQCGICLETSQSTTIFVKQEVSIKSVEGFGTEKLFS